MFASSACGSSKIDEIDYATEQTSASFIFIDCYNIMFKKAHAG